MPLTALLLFIQLFFCLSLSAQSSGKGNFLLKGKIDGNAQYLVLSYTDSLEKAHDDTASITQGLFEFKGIINGVTVASLAANSTSRLKNDPNRMVIFLEPALMEIVVTVNDFPSAVVTGSIAHNEYKKFDNALSLLDKERATISKSIDSLTKVIAAGGNSEAFENQIKALNKRLSAIPSYNESRNKFVGSKSNSAVVAYLLKVMIPSGKISIDSAENLYNQFPMALKNNALGVSIKQAIVSKRALELSKITLVENSRSPMLKGLDINGKLISNEDYKGKKYVLLNFWATWCGPCHEEFPFLNALYDKYGKDQLEIIGVSADHNKDRVLWKQDIVKSKIGRWKHMLAEDDLIKERGKQVAEKFAITAYPTLLLIDKNGIIIYITKGTGKDNVEKIGAIISASVKH